MVVDDEMINQQILGHILSEDYNVIFASDGESAIERMRENADMLSLVLLYLMMPGMNGIDVLKTVKEDEQLASIPIIVVTSDRQAEVESLTLGATDFIPKPYPEKDVVLARVLKTIELSEDRQTPSWFTVRTARIMKKSSGMPQSDFPEMSSA